MHDLAAVAALLDHLMGGAVPPASVAEVRVRAGASFSPEALEQAYEMLALGTPLEGSRLVVESSPEELVCGACGSRWRVAPEDVAGHLVLCPSCGAPSALRHGGRLAVLEVSPSGDRGGPSAPPG